MTRATRTCLRLVGFALAASHAALAQQCYYPNGADAPEKPCSSADGSACCPDKWECLDNGLCHYEPDNLYGRYSCTDKSWKASGCPSNMCTYDMSAAGGESITQCSDHDNQWCCNADATHVNCCKESPEPRPFFQLQDGKAYATVGASTAAEAPELASITGLASGSGGGDSPSSTPPPSSGGSSGGSSTKETPSTSATPTPVTSLKTSITTGSAGPSTVIETVVTTQLPATTSEPTATNANEPAKKSKTPIIVGCAVGIPLVLALAGILIWLLRKRSHQKRAPPYSETPDPYANGTASPDFAGGARLTKNGNYATKYKAEAGPGVAELPPQTVGPERPVSLIPGKAEMDSGSGFVPGTTPFSPHLAGVGGGSGAAHTPQSSWGSAPPGYSPGQNQAAWAQHGAGGPGQDSAPTAAAAAPAATQGGRYIPYRVPPDHPAAALANQQAHLSNVPEMAELGTVTTPPEAQEMGHGRTPPATAELGGPSPPAAAELNAVRTPPA